MWVVFVECDAAPIKEPPDLRRPSADVARGGEALGNLLQRDVLRLLREGKNEGLMRVELAMTRVTLPTGPERLVAAEISKTVLGSAAPKPISCNILLTTPMIA